MSTRVSAYAGGVAIKLYVSDCPSCGVVFGIPTEYEDRRRKDGAKFYCPNGHHMWWTPGKSDAKKLEESRARELALQDQLTAAIRDAETSRAELLRIQSRIANGVCPCCNRTFGNVRAHMQSQHPDFTVDLPKGKAVVYRCSCGQRFETYKGLRIHQGKSRGDEWDQPDTSKWSSHLTVV